MEKRGRGRPKKTDEQRRVERAMKVYEGVKGEDDPALSLIPFGAITRKTAMDKVSVNRLLSAKRLGVPDKKAANLAGITANTVYNWKKWGEEELDRRQAGLTPDTSKDPYVGFFAAYMEATSAPLVSALEVVQEHVEEGRNLDAARWMAERLAPEQFSPTRRVEVSGQDGGNIQVSHILEIPPERVAFLQRGDEISDVAMHLGETVEGEYEELT